MPMAPRVSTPGTAGIGKRIAFSILGTPANLKEKKTSAQKEIDKKLLFQNSQRVR
jgi:hypothetical protein